MTGEAPPVNLSQCSASNLPDTGLGTAGIRIATFLVDLKGQSVRGGHGSILLVDETGGNPVIFNCNRVQYIQPVDREYTQAAKQAGVDLTHCRSRSGQIWGRTI